MLPDGSQKKKKIEKLSKSTSTQNLSQPEKIKKRTWKRVDVMDPAAKKPG